MDEKKIIRAYDTLLMLNIIIITIAIMVGGVILMGLSGALVYIITRPFVKLVLTNNALERLHPENVWPLSIVLSIVAPLGIIPGYYFSFIHPIFSAGKSILIFIIILFLWFLLSSLILHLIFMTNKNEFFISLCIRENADKIKNFLKKKPDMNYLSRQGFTPLNEIVKRNERELAGLFITQGADVNKPADYGLTPLHIAARGNNTEIIELLFKAGAHPDAIDNNGNTPLLLACKYGNTAAASILIENKAGKDIQDKNGVSAYQAAIQNGLTEIAEKLVNLPAAGEK